MLLAANIFRGGGSIARGILNGVVGLGKIIANMLYLQDWIAKGLIMRFTDVSDASIWGSVTVNRGAVEGYGLWGIASNVYKIAAIAGFGLFLAYWLINIIEKSNQDRLNGSEFARLGIQLIVGMAMIMYGPVLMHSVTNFSNWSINIINEGMELQEKKGDTTFADDENNNKNNNKNNNTSVHSTGNTHMDDALQWIGFRKGTKPINAKNWCGQACDLCYIIVSGAPGQKSLTKEELEEIEKITAVFGEDFIIHNTYDKTNPISGYVENAYLGYGGNEKIEDAWAYYNPGEAIGMMLKAVVVLVIEGFLFIVNLILLVIISATALSRSIQIFLYVMFAPLAFADTFHQGFINSKSWRFIQRFLGLCIQSGIIYASVILAPKVALKIAAATSGELPGVGSGSLSNVVISGLFIAIGYLTALGLSQKAAQISNDIVGA